MNCTDAAACPRGGTTTGSGVNSTTPTRLASLRLRPGRVDLERVRLFVHDNVREVGQEVQVSTRALAIASAVIWASNQ